jgi:hypothetical protein
MRYLDHRARRAMAGNDDGGIAARIQVERMVGVIVFCVLLFRCIFNSPSNKLYLLLQMDMMEREIALDDSDSDIDDVEMHIEMADDEFLIDHAAQAL